MQDNDLSTDPRWRRLWERPWRCRACEQEHLGLPDLACGKPEQWPGSEDKAPNGDLDGLDRSFLSEDFCVLAGEHFFVRAVLELPIVGGRGDSFGIGVWSTLSLKNFELYLQTFDSGEQAGLGPWFGWFSNRINGYPDALNLKCQVYPLSGSKRPLIELEATGHPLFIEQQHGITFDRVLEIHALNGHDFRNSLND